MPEVLKVRYRAIGFAAVLGLTVAGAVVVSAIGDGREGAPQETKLGPDGLPLKPPPATPFDSVAYEQSVATARATGQQVLAEALADYNEGKLDYRALPIEVFDLASDLEAPTLSQVGGRSDAGVLAEVVKVEFIDGGFANLPGKLVTYRVRQAAFGPLEEGDEFQMSSPGGPLRRADGDAYLIVPFSVRESKGDIHLVFARVGKPGEPLLPASLAAALPVVDGKVADTEAARALGLTGKRDVDALETVASAKGR
ncbi:MAG TPA: hypothetical protein VFY90_13070 [Tepidiformaceae bacterium]|nr:hypothetical protein [Tepidiformaceae bacterium]HSE47131.1 hypothetical protein [Gemmatimonadales bacterium]